MILNKTKEIARLKNNLKIMQERNKDLYERDIEHQMFHKEEMKKMREALARVRIELEDTQGFLKQEKQLSAALRHQRNNLKKKLETIKAQMENTEEENESAE